MKCTFGRGMDRVKNRGKREKKGEKWPASVSEWGVSTKYFKSKVYQSVSRCMAKGIREKGARIGEVQR